MSNLYSQKWRNIYDISQKLDPDPENRFSNTSDDNCSYNEQVLIAKIYKMLFILSFHSILFYNCIYIFLCEINLMVRTNEEYVTTLKETHYTVFEGLQYVWKNLLDQKVNVLRKLVLGEMSTRQTEGTPRLISG